MKRTAVPKNRAWLTHAALASVLSVSGCVPWLRIAVMPGERPSFAVSGTITSGFRDKVSRLDVSGTRIVDGCPSGPDTLLWEIRVVGEAREVPPVVYGQVPAGFAQTFPPEGKAPPPLERGWIYTVGVHGSGVGTEGFDDRGEVLTDETLQRMGLKVRGCRSGE
jgi:hypothetical protein